MVLLMERTLSPQSSEALAVLMGTKENLNYTFFHEFISLSCFPLLYYQFSDLLFIQFPICYGTTLKLPLNRSSKPVGIH